MDCRTKRGSWDEKEKKAHSLNAKATNTLFCSLCETEYTRLSRCTLAQEIWELLQVTYNGTSQVKNSKISFFTSQYEAFKIEDGESINVMCNRFIDIVVALQIFVKDLDLDEINRKLFASIPIE